jgi:tricorn protease-like protein
LLVSAPPTLWRAHGVTGKVERLQAELRQRDSVRLHPDGRRVAHAAGKVKEEVWVVKLDQRKVSVAETPPRE